ncbi:DEAD/DEAH box helicase [Nocardia donostiensis]|uniref:DEAD/DEAH box helicase n=1 Tax=Nocardia donostiensis TaxID=1538463 RepID=A0A1V2TE63_9NOCA|nr:DEAD/DEAH box helicase [Nocardia donostiensis]ONM47758.1 DEAD/DEAH box helicase [Nocardia donostiensis]OQS13689.1 DEAD/DEAH box helicase [Nocardia donostiensis]OQS22510.1 DEAD/DEAH box helicase [Nocardia donostiensis]
MDLTELLEIPGTDADALYESFGAWAAEQGTPLYPAQDEALLELASESNVILATPTGSGKSLVAVGAHLFALSRGQRTYYTAPIKALVSEKFFALCEVFGADRVGMVTGDAAVNADAPIICATAEILANLALREGAAADIGQVVMDEFHFYADPDRGWAWQVPLLELPRAQFLLMSATLGEVDFFAADLKRRTGRSTAVVAGTERPVPLSFSYARTSITETLEELVTTHQAPVYVVHFTQAAALERAQALTSVNFASRAEKDAIAEAVGQFRFSSGFGKTLSRLIRHGIGVHHAGMLPKYRRLVERLAQDGLLKVVCGTDTLGVGINVPIRTVLLTGLTKFDGVRTRRLKAREFHQIAGRAGRAGFDTMGTVVVQAPEHEVENTKLLAKAGDDPKKLRKVQRRKPPEGFVSWSEETFQRLVAAPPEPMVSRFTVTNSMLLNVISRPGNCFDAMRHLLEDNHEPRPAQRRHILRAIRLYRALRDAGVVQQLPEPDAQGRRARLTVDLQRDFALDQPLSPFALAALELLDPASPGYALDVVSLVESTLEDPRQVLLAQQHKARGEAVAEMKADGIDYDERMELLEEVTWPTPLAEMIEPAYETYRAGHPWLSEFAPSPKSVVRDMVERAMTFAELISYYELARSEGVVLRYLADAYRALRRTVPETARTEELDDITEWLGELVRQVDSSLLDEWEQLTGPGAETDAEQVAFGAETIRPISANERAFRVLIRNAMFRRVELAARRDWDALADLGPGPDWETELAPYFAEYGSIGTGPDARGPQLFQARPRGDFWEVRQVLDDPAGDRGWALIATVDPGASDAAGEVVFDEVSISTG